jgi:hypothetical protein
MPRRPKCWLCGELRRIVRVMRRVGEGDQGYDDPDYAIRICDTCDVVE